MIKINLLRERKKVRRAPKGQMELAIAFLTLVACGNAVYWLKHKPLMDSLDEKTRQANKVKNEIKDLEARTRDFDAVLKQADTLTAQVEAIQRLNAARAVPAWFLYELSRVLTRDNDPTMTDEMIDQVKVVRDPNRTYRDDWDPRRVWLEKLEEKDGKFTITGGATADTDATQLALRLQASVFFRGVTPEGGSSVEDKKTRLSYYRFTISGKAVY